MGRLGGPGTNQHAAKPQRPTNPAPGSVQVTTLRAQAATSTVPGSGFLERIRAKDTTLGTPSPADFGIPVDPDPPQGMWARGPRYEDEWEQAFPERVAISELVATQDFLDVTTLAHYLDGGAAPTEDKRDMPRVAIEDGIAYLIDGHHRTAIEAATGETEIDAWVVEC